MAHHIAMTSAALLLGAGSYALVSTGSKASFIGSAALATMFGGSAYMIKQTDKVFEGCCLGAVGGLATLAVGASRYAKSQKKAVPLFLIALGLIDTPFYTRKAIEWKQ
eukprot:GDKI01002748.1.p1 GENE.GDKI01002748.1~~GDKI01002748.1.p1  ORF type:complete len:108 (+),score=22.40 GDKI01002748.1:78-401(+)